MSGGVFSMPISDLNKEFENWAGYTCKRVPKSRWYRFCSTVMGFTSNDMKLFKEGSLDKDDMYDIIDNKLMSDSDLKKRFLQRHRGKVKSEDARAEIDSMLRPSGNKSFTTPTDRMLAIIIYEIIDEVPPKDRRGFCSREFAMQHRALDKFRESPVDEDLMMDMLKGWWSTKADMNEDVWMTTKQRAINFLQPATADEATLLVSPSHASCY